MSGRAVLAALQAQGGCACLRSRRADLHVLKEEGFDRASSPHGRGGEDGTGAGRARADGYSPTPAAV